MAMYHPGHPNGKYQMANLLRDAQRDAMGEPEDSPAVPLLEGIVRRVQADLRWPEGCKPVWMHRRGR